MSQDHKSWKAAYMRQWNAKRRRELLALFDSKCAHCGITDERVLDFDHIDGGGKRSTTIRGTSWRRMQDIKEHPELYRVLCRNCNWIAHLEKLAQQMSEYTPGHLFTPGRKEIPTATGPCPGCGKEITARKGPCCDECQVPCNRLYNRANQRDRRTRRKIA